jgi:hypothetical protein
MVSGIHRGLWERIEAFQVDDPSEVAFPFVVRLARENGWSREFADRVFNEYKRFAFLTIVAGHPCTPSDQVDQAWHLHLTYTRSYWEELCSTVLPRPLHHDPTKGGEAESNKFDEWYARTKRSYERIFGHEPPVDIWPPAAIRFGEDLHYTRVNTKRCWVIPKEAFRRKAKLGVGAAAVLLAAGGCTLTPESGLFLAIFFLALFAIGILLVVGSKRGWRGNGDGGGWFSGCGGGSGCGSSGCGGGCGGGGCGGCGG